MTKKISAIAAGIILALSCGSFAACGTNEYGDRTPVRLWSHPFTETETQAWLEEKVDAFNRS